MAMKLGTILVPLDGSALAELALPRAIELARVSGATLLLLRAAMAHTVPGLDSAEAQIRVVEEAEGYLASTAARLRSAGVATVETATWYGAAAFAIVEAARLRKVDMIVMTTHGRSGLPRLVFGSVAESVLRSTATPLLLVRPPEAPVAPMPDAGAARPWTGREVHS
jgi:nucleotide-binding universal stress UspA family protein